MANARFSLSDNIEMSLVKSSIVTEEIPETVSSKEAKVEYQSESGGPSIKLVLV